MTKPSRPRVLLIDDGSQYAALLREGMPAIELVGPRGSEGPRAPDGPSAFRYLKRHADAVDLVLLDMDFDLDEAKLVPFDPPKSARRTRRFQGLRILQVIRERWPAMPVVLLTSQEELTVLPEGEAAGAESMTHVLDGDDLDALRIRMHAALDGGGELDGDPAVFWGTDAGAVALRKRMAMLARGPLPLMLEGETGTGKSYLAERFVHRHSGRQGKFVVLDLSTVPSELVSAHLFGAVRGAYTGAVEARRGVFEAADGGTLFIDEIQNVPLEVQKQLLLVLQDGRVRRLGSTDDVRVDVKVIAASNEPLSGAVTAGRFRSDLYMRLSPATRLRIPPLRERRGDLPALSAAFVRGHGEGHDLSPLRRRLAVALGLSADAPLSLRVGGKALGEPEGLPIHLPRPAFGQLVDHPYPGNLRELSMVWHNLVSGTLVEALDAERSGAAFRGGRLQIDPLRVPELLSASRELPAPGGVAPSATAEGATVVRVVPADTLNGVAQAVERQYLSELFRRAEGDLSRMAEWLLGDPGRSRAVRLRMNQLGLSLRTLRGG